MGSLMIPSQIPTITAAIVPSVERGKLSCLGGTIRAEKGCIVTYVHYLVELLRVIKELLLYACKLVDSNLTCC